MQTQDLINLPLGFNTNYYYNKQTNKLYLREPVINSYGQYDYTEVKPSPKKVYYLSSYDKIRHTISQCTIKRLINPAYNFNNYIPVKSAFKPFNYYAVKAYFNRRKIKLPACHRVIDPLGRYVYAFKQNDLDRLKALKKIYMNTQYNPNSFTTLKNLPRFHNYYYDPVTKSIYNLKGRKLKECQNGTYALTINNKKKYISVNKIKKKLQL